MVIFLNIIQDLVLVLFLISAVYVMIQDRYNTYGVWARNKGNNQNGSDVNILIDGHQGVDLSIGKQNYCDIVVRSEKTPDNPSYLTYDGKKVFGADKASESYRVGDEDIAFIKSPVGNYLIRFKFLPVLLTIFFLIIRYITLCHDYAEGSKLLLVPFLILLVYLVISSLLDVNTSPVVESSLAILLSFHIYSSLYSAYGRDYDIVKGRIVEIIIGISIYVLAAILVRLFVTYFHYNTEFDIKGLQRINNKWVKKLLGETVTSLDLLRFACFLVILILTVMNLIMAVLLNKKVNGAYNWISIGGLKFQPSEFIKPMFLIMLLVPLKKQFKAPLNLTFMFLISLGVFFYAVMIKDIGFLLEIAAVWFLQIIIFSNNLRVAMVLSSGAFLGAKLILKISGTAYKRFFAWKGKDNGFLASLFGSFVENYRKNEAYQPYKALSGAFANGRAFGRRFEDVDILNGVMAGDSDLVTSIISQRYGYISLFLILGVIIIILLGALRNMSRQNKNQQALTMMTCVLMSVAYILNIGGTYGVIPLTGVVAPGLSRGNSSSISYGACFGFITCVSPYVRDIFRNTKQIEFKRGKLLSAAYTVPAISKALDMFSSFDIAVDNMTNKASDRIREIFKKTEDNKSVIKIKSLRTEKEKNKEKQIKTDKPDRKRKVGKWIGLTALILVAVLMISVFADIGKALSNINQREKAEHAVAAADLVRDTNVYNILLLGVDARSEDEDESSRADTMLMVSVDKNNKAVKMTSFLRDSYVYIPARKSKGRLNSASSYGGYSGVVDAIEHNFKVGVDGYAVVDFEMFKVLIDAIGGITIDVSEKEANEINKHKKRYGNVSIEAGEHNLSGDQALAYARIRKIDTDFVRTKRQRTVMSAIIQKAKSRPFKFLKAMKKASAFIETDLTRSELLKCAAGAVKCSKHIYQDRVPFEKTWEYATVNGASVIKMNIKKNKEKLIHFIFEATPEELDKEKE